MRTFNEIDDLIDALKFEASIRTRFPARFVLVSGLVTWQEFITRLRHEVSEVMELSSLCVDAHTFPYSGEILTRLSSSQSDRVLLLPLAEYFRFIGDPGKMIPQLATLEQVGKKRIYVPLFEIAAFFHSQMEKVSRLQRGEAGDVWAIHGSGRASFTIAPFAPKTWTHQIVRNIQDYLRVWERGGKEALWLVYPDVGNSQLIPQVGLLTTKIYTSAFGLLKDQVVGFDVVQEGWGTPDQWQWLVNEIRESETLEQALLRQLNVLRFDSGQLLTTWKNLDINQRWLVLLWAKLMDIPDSLLSRVALNVNDPNELQEAVANVVFELDLNLDMLEERAALLQKIGCTGLPSSFWIKYSGLKTPLQKLKSLCSLSSREKEETVLVTRELLKSGLDITTWLPYLTISCAELESYLTEPLGCSPSIEEYFRLYRFSRVIDEPLPEFFQIADAINQHKEDIWTFDTRGSSLEGAKHVDDNVEIVWLDGVGAEWNGLICAALRHKGYVVESKLCRVSLPSTTEFNKEWEGKEIDRTVDDIAHHYGYQFPQSFVRQLTHLSGIADKVNNLLKRNSELLITSDHGLTRFAGGQGKVEAPEGAIPHKWGRYAILPAEMPVMSIPAGEWIVEENNLILATHHLFKGGTQHGGEVHGGATLEECLVPLIHVSQPKKILEKVLTFTLEHDTVKCGINGEGDLIGTTNHPARNISLFVAGQLFPGNSKDGITWIFRIEGLKPGRYNGKLRSENTILTEIDFQLVRGITEEDLGL